MTIPELLTDVQNMKNYRKLPKYITVTDISESQVEINGKFQSMIYSWGILQKDGQFIYFETDDERGYLSCIKRFNDENSACEHAKESLEIINDASPSEREYLTTVILKKEDGLMLIKQYGKKYIRFAAGEIAEMLYQVPVTPDEAMKMRLGEYSMADVVNSYSNQGKLKPDMLIDNPIRDYLEQNTKYSDKRKNKIIEGLRKHGDIFYEFYYYVLTGKFEEKGVTVEGFDAKTLHEKYPLSVLGAYNYLIYLREDPENALRDLKNGLPRK